MLTNKQVEEFISRHSLPEKFRELIDLHYSTIAAWIIQQHRDDEALFVGISGAQGTGKSTLAAYLQLALETDKNWHVVVLSIDDFYLTKTERQQLAESLHPLLRTRGVPGTHDMRMLAGCIEQLKRLDRASGLSIPRFDKALDDRANSDTWPLVSGPVDLIILEGWCVGSSPQTDADLSSPINALEREQDASGQWRHYVNGQLEGIYADQFAKLDELIFLQAPNFDAVYRWRLEQEEKLAEAASQGSTDIMNGEQVAQFIRHYERLTKANLATLPDTANVVLELDENHDCLRSRYTSTHN